jgi:hypothetical protein
MAQHREADSDEWGNHIARITFVATLVLAVCFVGTVIFFIIIR